MSSGWWLASLVIAVTLDLVLTLLLLVTTHCP
jgi:hypothetical protein